MGKISFRKFREMAQDQGITSYTIRKNPDIKIGQSTWKTLINDELTVNTKTIAELCKIFQCQPGDLMEYIPDEE